MVSSPLQLRVNKLGRMDNMKEVLEGYYLRTYSLPATVVEPSATTSWCVPCATPCHRQDRCHPITLPLSPCELERSIRARQQRLLLLHHAANCTCSSPSCPLTKHCGRMKSLWKHMIFCKSNFCKVPYCYSSRVILKHFMTCQDLRCKICHPVRRRLVA